MERVASSGEVLMACAYIVSVYLIWNQNKQLQMYNKFKYPLHRLQPSLNLRDGPRGLGFVPGP